MRTVTVDILQDEAINLLKDLEALKVIKLHHSGDEINMAFENPIKKLKGTIARQSHEEVEAQLRALRNEWD